MSSILPLQHLYIMQNEFGLIKIGRSINPENRRLTLQYAEKCRIEIVRVFNNQGNREEEFHTSLAGHRLVGEWFCGSDLSIQAIEAVFSPKMAIRWPFEFDAKRSDQWLEDYWDRSVHDWRPGSISNLHGYLRRAESASWTTDLLAWDIHCILEYGDRFVGSVVDGGDGEPQTVCEVGGARVVVPKYTQDIDAALSLWPDTLRPTSWSGSAFDCCKSAIEVRRAKWREHRAAERAARRRRSSSTPAN